MELIRGLKASLGVESPVYRESSASYPPLSTMQQQSSSAALQMQLQALQLQMQQQQQQAQQSQSFALQQPRTSGLGGVTATIPDTSGLRSGPSSGTLSLCVLVVTNESSLAAILQQALSQVQVPLSLYAAAAHEMWAMLEQIKTVTGRAQGPDIVFFQPEVLVANPGTVTRLKQACGAACVAVVLQASEAVARVLHADDFLPGPTAIHPLRKEDLANLLLKWRSRQQSSSTSSTVSSVGSATGGPNPAAPTPVPTLSAAPTMTSMSALSRTSNGLTNGLTHSGMLPQLQAQQQQPQLSQLQQLQAQLQALQQAKLQQATGGAGAGAGSAHATPRGLSGAAGGGGAAHGAAHGAASEIEPAGPGSASVSSGLGPRVSPPHRPPPLRLASAGITPADTQPDAGWSLARSSTPAAADRSSDVQDLVAQVAELRRRLGDKSRTASMRSPAISGTGAALGAGGPASPAGSTGSTAGIAPQLSQQLPGMPSADLQQKLQELQQQQQLLMQRLASTGSTMSQQQQPGGGNGSSISPPGRPVPMGSEGSSGGATAAPVNRPMRRLGLENHGSLVRPAAAAAAASVLGPQPSGPSLNTQLQQQLLQLQQLQLQLQQQQQQQQQQRVVRSQTASAATPGSAIPSPSFGSAAGADTQLSARASSVSASGSLPSPASGALQSPGSMFGGNVDGSRGNSNNAADGGAVSRSNSFVAAGGTRYRPPRQRSPSPLGGAASGHMSDGFMGLGPSRFSSSPLRSGSGGTRGQGAAGGGSGTGGVHGGTGSGYTSDGAASPDISVRDSARSGSLHMLSKSGDDAIAAALSAAASDDGDPHAEEERVDSPRKPAAAAVPATARAGKSSGRSDGGAFNQVFQDLEPEGGGGGGGGGGGDSSTDGRSLMDASFALDDSGGAGRGSANGGGGSSIDLQPTPRRDPAQPSRASAGAAAAAAAAVTSADQQAPNRQRSNLGGTAVGSHRLPSVAQSLQELPQEEEEEQPLAVGPSRRQDQQASAASAAARSRPTGSVAAPAAGLRGQDGRAERSSSQPAVTSPPASAHQPEPLPMLTPPKPAASSPQKQQAADAGTAAPTTMPSTSGSRLLMLESWSQTMPLDELQFASPGEEDVVRVASPDVAGSARDLHLGSSGAAAAPAAPAVDSPRSNGTPAAPSAATEASATSKSSAAAAALARKESLTGARLPSIDGTRPLAAVSAAEAAAAAAAPTVSEISVAAGVAGPTTATEAAAAPALSAEMSASFKARSGLSQTSASAGGAQGETGSAAVSVSLAAGGAAAAGPQAAAATAANSPTISTERSASDSNSAPAAAKPQAGVLQSTASGRALAGASGLPGGVGSSMALVASIEGSIAAGVGFQQPVAVVSAPSPEALMSRTLSHRSTSSSHRGGGGAGAYYGGNGEGSTATSRVTAPVPAGSGFNGQGGSPHSAATAASATGHPDDIFSMLHLGDRDAGSPAPLAPPRSSTPPARRLARILMSSHPIVITREDFLPF